MYLDGGIHCFHNKDFCWLMKIINMAILEIFLIFAIPQSGNKNGDWRRVRLLIFWVDEMVRIILC